MIKTIPGMKRNLDLKKLAGFVTAIAMLFMPFTVNALFENEIKLLASDGVPGDSFGYSVSIDGDAAIVGAYGKDNDNGDNSGAAYIFVRDPATGAWTQQKLLSSDGVIGDRFGYSVSISGDTAIVGADLDDDRGSSSGSAYVFVRNPATGVWTEQKLLASDGAAGDNFGRFVSISGDTAIVGAPDKDNASGVRTGAAYVFVRTAPGVWTEQMLLASDGAYDDQFGSSVSISGDTVIVGAFRDDYIGSAYIFARDPGTGVWRQQQKLLASDGVDYDFFGLSVSISGDTAIVGASRDDDNGDNSGSAYLFVRDATGVWVEQKLLASDGATADEFGSSVSISGDTAIVGASRHADNGGESGAVYVFVRDSATGVWTEQKLLASDGVEGDTFGWSVSISGDTVIAGTDWTEFAYVYQEPDPSPPPPLPTAEISVRAIEVTQAVQDWNNTVTLIEGKTTVVRAFVEVLPGESPRTIAARLYGKRGTQTLPDSPVSPVNNRLSIDTNIELRRATLGDSFNFRLPVDWASGDVNLKLVLLDLSGTEILTDCNEPGGTSSDCAVSVSFDPSEKLSVKFFGISWLDTSVLRTASREDVQEQVARIESVYPLARIEAGFGTMAPFTAAPKLKKVNSHLKTQRLLDLANCGKCKANSRYYAVLVGSGPGLAVGNVASGFVALGQEGRDGVGYDRNRSGHELTHTFGISHTVDPNVPPKFLVKFGSCGSKSPITAAVFPDYGLINADVNDDGNTDSGGERAPLIGPLDAGVDSEIWGLDTRYLQDNTKNLSVIDPHETPAMLSYCMDGDPQGRWVSVFNYERLIDRLARNTSGSSLVGAVATYLFVSGIMDADGTTVQNSPVIEMSGAPILPTAGNYRVALNDATGTELAAIDFEPVAGEMRDAAEPGKPVDEPQQLFFTVPLMKPATPIAEIIVSNNGVEISRVVASPNLPSVVITQPTAGQSLTTNTVTLAWQGSDADGDALTYTVQYSPDGGVSWTSLAVNTPAESFELERAYLDASTDARIQIAVSDGVNTSVATSDAFSVANSGPLVLIKQPRTGLSFSGGQTVIFEVFTYDTEDGSIADASIAWASDIDGALGTGRELILNTLTTGLHTITVTATDSAGTPSSESTVLGIGVPLPDITVTDAITPVNDQQIPFADLTIGGSSDQTITMNNDGNADLVIGSIASADALAAPFSVVNDTCSGQTVAAAGNCTFSVRFAPTAVGAFNDSFDIPSNDPDENPSDGQYQGAGSCHHATFKPDAGFSDGRTTRACNQRDPEMAARH